VVQIDGLSHRVLELALRGAPLPTLAGPLRGGALRKARVPVGLPTPTAAFQARVMSGGPVDIPAFEFLDKRTRGSVSDPGAAADRRGQASARRGGRARPPASDAEWAIDQAMPDSDARPRRAARGAHRSPTRATRARTLQMWKSSRRIPSSTSRQVTGVDTVASGWGRTE
jgi:hypothetical protein